MTSNSQAYNFLCKKGLMYLKFLTWHIYCRTNLQTFENLDSTKIAQSTYLIKPQIVGKKDVYLNFTNSETLIFTYFQKWNVQYIV